MIRLARCSNWRGSARPRWTPGWPLVVRAREYRAFQVCGTLPTVHRELLRPLTLCLRALRPGYYLDVQARIDPRYGSAVRKKPTRVAEEAPVHAWVPAGPAGAGISSIAAAPSSPNSQHARSPSRERAKNSPRAKTSGRKSGRRQRLKAAPPPRTRTARKPPLPRHAKAKPGKGKGKGKKKHVAASTALAEMVAAAGDPARVCETLRDEIDALNRRAAARMNEEDAMQLMLSLRKRVQMLLIAEQQL